MASEPFQLSGRSSNTWLLPIVGVAAASASAFLYAWINVYSPVAGYVSVLFVALLAAGAVLPVAYAGLVLKVRSVMQMRIAGLATAVAALYQAWAFFAWVLVRKDATAEVPSAMDWIGHPEAIWAFAGVLAENGWYTIRNQTPSGVVLWLFWAIEAAIVLGAGWLLAPGFIQGRGFCEDCGAWMADEATLMVPTDDGGVAAAAREQGLTGIREVKPASRGGRWVRLARQRCPACRQRAVFRIDDVTMIKTRNGTTTKVTSIQPLAWQTDVEAAELERIGSLVQAADAERSAAALQESGAR